jgi:hypothetical protein
MKVRNKISIALLLTIVCTNIFAKEDGNSKRKQVSTSDTIVTGQGITVVSHKDGYSVYNATKNEILVMIVHASDTLQNNTENQFHVLTQKFRPTGMQWVNKKKCIIITVENFAYYREKNL